MVLGACTLQLQVNDPYACRRMPSVQAEVLEAELQHCRQALQHASDHFRADKKLDSIEPRRCAAAAQAAARALQAQACEQDAGAAAGDAAAADALMQR